MVSKGIKAESESVGRFLRRLSLFEGTRTSSLASLERACVSRQVSKGEYFFMRGDPADSFYLLQSGRVTISLTSIDGRELVINEVEPDDFFGELGLLTGEPRSADAMANVDSRVVSIPRQLFLSLVEAEPKLVLRILDITAKRLMHTSEFASALAFMDAQARLARVLLELDRQNQKKGFITISQEELAQRSGLIRQTVAKTLGQWRNSGWLLTGRGNIVLLNRAALSRWFEERRG